MADNSSIRSHNSGAFNRPGALGPGRTQHIYTLDTFSSKDFLVKDFVESLSDAAVPARKSTVSQSSQAFDPKPLIRTFEHALSRLKSLSEELEHKENELSANVRRAEAQHNTNVKGRAKDLESAMESFQRLERQLDGDGSGNAAMRIGERLEGLDLQRQRAQDAKFILQCWLDVSERGDLSGLDDIRKTGGGDGKVRCAHIARQLLKISQRLSAQPNGEVNGHDTDSNEGSRRRRSGIAPRELIEKFLESLEKELLRSFDDYYRRQNFDGMQECAVALRDFSDGNSVISLFVNQHQFFIDRAQLVTEEIVMDTDIWDRLADPDTEPPGVEPSLQSLIDEVKVVVQEESFIIRRAFPYYEEVMSRFLQRVFEQSIQQRLEMVLNRADSISSLAYLRALQASRSYIVSLVEDLKAHGLTEHPAPASSVTAAVLDQQLDELFVPYLTGSNYIEREKQNLGELYEGLLLKFTVYHSQRRRVKPSSYLGRLQLVSDQYISNAREAYIKRLDSSDIPPNQKVMLLRIAGLYDKDLNGPKGGNEVTDEDGQLSLPYTKRMLKWLAEGVGRGLELSGGGNDTPKEVRELLHLLISDVGEIYLETALDAANESAAAGENSKSEPDLNYIADLRSAISVLHLMLATIQMLLLPLASSNLTIRRDLENQTTVFVERMESKLDSVLHRTIDAALAWTSRLLSGQKKTDFRPRDDSAPLEQLQTPTCLSVYTFISKLHSRATAALSGRVLESFSVELATSLMGLLLQHFKSYQVSLTGALVVSKDITKYLELLRSWDLPAAYDANLDVLGEIANLFVVGPDALRDRLRVLNAAVAGTPTNEEGAKTTAAIDFRPYVLRREDASSVAVQTALNGL